MKYQMKSIVEYFKMLQKGFNFRLISGIKSGILIKHDDFIHHEFITHHVISYLDELTIGDKYINKQIRLSIKQSVSR